MQLYQKQSSQLQTKWPNFSDMKESFAIPDRKGTFPFVVLRLNMGLSFFVSTMKNIVNVISKEFHSLIFFLSQ